MTNNSKPVYTDDHADNIVTAAIRNKPKRFARELRQTISEEPTSALFAITDAMLIIARDVKARERPAQRILATCTKALHGLVDVLEYDTYIERQTADALAVARSVVKIGISHEDDRNVRNAREIFERKTGRSNAQPVA